MGYYNYLCELLRPLRVYRLDEGSLSGAELYAAGEGLDAAAEALEKAVREGMLMTAEDEGLSRRERLFSRIGARTTPALRWRSRRCCASAATASRLRRSTRPSAAAACAPWPQRQMSRAWCV